MDRRTLEKLPPSSIGAFHEPSNKTPCGPDISPGRSGPGNPSHHGNGLASEDWRGPGGIRRKETSSGASLSSFRTKDSRGSPHGLKSPHPLVCLDPRGGEPADDPLLPTIGLRSHGEGHERPDARRDGPNPRVSPERGDYPPPGPLPLSGLRALPSEQGDDVQDLYDVARRDHSPPALRVLSLLPEGELPRQCPPGTRRDRCLSRGSVSGRSLWRRDGLFEGEPRPLGSRSLKTNGSMSSSSLTASPKAPFISGWMGPVCRSSRARQPGDAASRKTAPPRRARPR